MAYRWILLLTVALHMVKSNEDKPVNDVIPHIYEPSWMYKCVPDQGCERTEHPHPLVMGNITAQMFGSLDVCRTVCGRFGGLWPRPVTAALSSQTVRIHPNYLRFDLVDVPAESRDLLVQMTKLVGDNLLAECGGNVTEIVETPIVVYISVKTAVTSLVWDTDEHYMLDVQTKEEEIAVHVVADTVFGARHAFETFTQLASPERLDDGEGNRCGLRLVSGAKIRDRPVYKHRGFVMDSSRHFIPMADIKRTIDGLAATKMNVFHWHVTDSHSFPLESSRVPQFTRYGAYSAKEIYTTEEVRELIEYAKVRGVRVVIEIDAPAHAGNGWQWGKEYGFGDLAVCVNVYPWRPYCIEPPCGQLNPANPAMYRVLRDLYRDIAETMTKPPLLHMGGDEVFLNCWNSSEEIVTYMKNKGWDTTDEGFLKLWGEFHEKALQIWDEEVHAAGAGDPQPVMLWSSELTQPQRIQRFLDKNRYIIEVWEVITSPLLSQLLRLGYRVVSVPKDIWYLDHGTWGVTKYSNWRRMYSHKLPTEDGVIGGEVAMWTEYCDSQVLGEVFEQVIDKIHIDNSGEE
ncbi:hypothetical protein O3G_MSEX003576 [Manduca sexta]|uniref:Chitooligosaccharidolytic beta-N-acetylglucosaminidase n=1 Tax=Manduca sexta TaxID=7130 RepID=A0A921YSL4_MANSE|nr:hypothetical protein O3G_MSEX003576 [Manduca sexta]